MVGTSDGKVYEWEADTGRRLAQFVPPDGAANVKAFSPDGNTALIWSRGELLIWDLATGKVRGRLDHRRIFDVAFNADGNALVTLSLDETVRFWEVATCRPIELSWTLQDFVKTLAFSPNGKYVLTASGNAAQLWDIARRSPIGPPMSHNKDLVLAIAFSGNGKTIATGSWDNTARLWETGTGNQIGRPLKHTEPVSAVSFSPDGNSIATITTSKEARLWSTKTAKTLEPRLLPQHPLNAIFSPDSQRVLAWDFSTAALATVPKPISGEPERIAIWIQVVTGMELDEINRPHVLDAATWQERRQRLQELGGPPEQ